MKEERAGMTRRDMALELIRLKRSVPVLCIVNDTVYASMQEAADELGIQRQYVSKEVAKSKHGKTSKFVPAVDWEPYKELKACKSVDDYVLHYIRVYFPELYEDSLHVVKMNEIEAASVLAEIMNLSDPVIVARDGEVWDTLTGEKIMSESE